MSTLSRDELGKLAQFKLLMRKIHQYSVDLSALVKDQEYARQVFDLAEDTDQEDLMLLAIELRAQFGLLSTLDTVTAPIVTPQPPEVAPTVTPEVVAASIKQPSELETPAEDKQKDRYKFSLR